MKAYYFFNVSVYAPRTRLLASRHAARSASAFNARLSHDEQSAHGSHVCNAGASWIGAGVGAAGIVLSCVAVRSSVYGGALSKSPRPPVEHAVNDRPAAQTKSIFSIFFMGKSLSIVKLDVSYQMILILESAKLFRDLRCVFKTFSVA